MQGICRGCRNVWGLGFTCWCIAGNGGLEKKTEITMCYI